MPYRDAERAVQNRSHPLAQPISADPLRALDDVEYITMQWVDRYNNLLTRRGYQPPARYAASCRHLIPSRTGAESG